MKNKKVCPKCNGNNIVRFDGYVGTNGSGSFILTGATIFSAVNVNRYVCCDCGFVEQWIDDADLEAIKESTRKKQ